MLEAPPANGNLEHYLLPLRFACCSMYYLQCIYGSVAIVTSRTVHFLMLTHCSVQSKSEEYALRDTSATAESHPQCIHGPAKLLLLSRYSPDRELLDEVQTFSSSTSPATLPFCKVLLRFNTGMHTESPSFYRRERQNPLVVYTRFGEKKGKGSLPSELRHSLVHRAL